ncbi:MAG: hypothetical protein ACKOUS_09120, partial [Alphaproteobacteria bacterium]
MVDEELAARDPREGMALGAQRLAQRVLGREDVGGARLLAGLAAALEAGDPAARVPVDITVAAGPVYRVRRIEVGGLPAGRAVRARLVPGPQARAADILAAEDALREALRAEGHAFARIARREL